MSELIDSHDTSDNAGPSPGAIHDVYDADGGGSVGYAVVTATAAAAGTDPLDLPPLYESVDVDALDALVARDRGDGRVTFEYAGFEVTVAFDGRIRLDPIDAPTLR